MVKYISKVSRTPIEELAGKAAVFVRGFCEYLVSRDDQNETSIPTVVKLRKAQDAGKSAVEALGETISVPYLSQLSGKIEKAGVYRKQQFGKSYNLILDNEKALDRVRELLTRDDYGHTVDVQFTVEELGDRSAIIHHLEEYDGVRIHAKRPAPKASYQVLMDRFQKGELIMVFCNPDDPAFGDEYPEFARASVSDQNDDDDA